MVGDLGNRAVHDQLARALAQCQIQGLDVEFSYCNLSKESVQLLADAVEQNTSLVAFKCVRNPFNYPNGRDKDPRTEEPIRQAIIRSRAPITEWDGEELPQDMVLARQERAEATAIAEAASREAADRATALAPVDVQRSPEVAVEAAKKRTTTKGRQVDEGEKHAKRQAGVESAEITQALIRFGLKPGEAEVCTATLASHGYDSLQRIGSMDIGHVDDCGIKGFSKRVVLVVRATQNAAAAASSSSSAAAAATLVSGIRLPALPAGVAFYAFMSHNWGVDNVNHQRVQRIVDRFAEQGVLLWFDDERLTDHVEHQITEGIDNSATFVVCVTRAYVEKVQRGPKSASVDRCYYEFNYAGKDKRSKTIAVVMDEEMLDTTKWDGPVGGRLLSALYIDFSSDDKLEQCCKELAKAIADKMNKKE